jgi:hypothetical protein
MNIERLNILIDILENVQREHKEFDISHWADISNNIENNDPICGTTACAMGYAALDPRFSELGLHLVATVPFNENYDGADTQHNVDFIIKDNDDMNNLIKLLIENPHGKYDLVDFYIEYGNHQDFNAGEKFFDISQPTSMRLFYGGHYGIFHRGASNVIDRIQYLVDNGETKFLVKYP